MYFCGKYPLKSWNVPSRSSQSVFYTIDLWGDAKLTCSCPNSIFNRKVCRHIKEKEEELRASFGGIQEATIFYKKYGRKKN